MKRPVPFLFLMIAVVFVIVVLRDYRAKTSLQQALGTLQTNLQELARQVAALQPEQPGAAVGHDTSAEITENTAELTRLRREVAQLQERVASLEQANATVSNTLAIAQGANIPFVYSDSTKRTDYTFTGYTSPQSAFESMMWAVTKMDAKAFSSCLTGKWLEVFARQCQNLPEGVMPGGYANGDIFKATGFRVVEETPVSHDEVHLKVFLEGSRETIKPVFQRVNGEWKWGGNDLGN